VAHARFEDPAQAMDAQTKRVGRQTQAAGQRLARLLEVEGRVVVVTEEKLAVLGRQSCRAPSEALERAIELALVPPSPIAREVGPQQPVVAAVAPIALARHEARDAVREPTHVEDGGAGGDTARQAVERFVRHLRGLRISLRGEEADEATAQPLILEARLLAVAGEERKQRLQAPAVEGPSLAV
jgi:hypothetical protein